MDYALLLDFLPNNQPILGSIQTIRKIVHFEKTNSSMPPNKKYLEPNRPAVAFKSTGLFLTWCKLGVSASAVLLFSWNLIPFGLLFSPSYTYKLLWDYSVRWIGIRSLRRIAEKLCCISSTYGKTVYNIEVPENRRGDTTQYVSLTIDDSPGDDPTVFEKLLEILRKKKVKVSFFVTSTYANTPRMKSLLKSAVDDGHELCNHMPEDKPYANSSNKYFQEQFQVTENFLQNEIVAEPSKWFRAPGGLISPSMMKYVTSLGYKHVLADVWGNDVKIRDDPQYHIEYISKETMSGSIIIMHAPEIKKKRLQTIEVVDNIIDNLRVANFKFLTLTELEKEYRMK